MVKSKYQPRVGARGFKLRFHMRATDIKIITQYHEGIPPLWRYPREFGGYFDNTDYETHKRSQCKCWYHSSELIKKGTTLQDIVSKLNYPRGAKPLAEATLDKLAGEPALLEERREGFRWWIEGRNY